MDIDRFDVDNSELREFFLSRTVPHAIRRLDSAITPGWGRMNAQQMIEHLLWAFELSTGRASTACEVAAAELPRMTKFLHSNRPTPHDFMNPALVRGLPPLRHATLAEATAALERELERFLHDPRLRDLRFTHPIFGVLTHEEWHRVHYKHTHHHLQQFGLIVESGT